MHTKENKTKINKMKQTKTHTKPDKKTCKSMLDPANSVTVEKGSTMRQKFNSSNTNPRGRIKKKIIKMLGMNSTGNCSPHKSTDVLASVFEYMSGNQSETRLRRESI